MKPITVSRSSWHYRYIHHSTVHTTRSTNDLCSYLGGFVRTFLKQVWFYGLFLFSAFSFLLVPVALALGEILATVNGDFAGIALCWGCVIWLFGMVVGIGWAISALRKVLKRMRYRAWLKKYGREDNADSWYEYRRDVLYRPAKVTTFRYLLRERIRATKKKVCPVLEVKP